MVRSGHGLRVDSRIHAENAERNEQNGWSTAHACERACLALPLHPSCSHLCSLFCASLPTDEERRITAYVLSRRLHFHALPIRLVAHQMRQPPKPDSLFEILSLYCCRYCDPRSSMFNINIKSSDTNLINLLSLQLHSRSPCAHLSSSSSRSRAQVRVRRMQQRGDVRKRECKILCGHRYRRRMSCNLTRRRRERC